MRATQLLREQHEAMRDLFQRLEDAESEIDKLPIFEELASTLVAHDAIERELFYPACEEQLGPSERLGESVVEHGLVEFALYQTDLASASADFAHKCAVLRDTLAHHIEAEERELFPDVERALSADRMEELAEEMATRYERARARDFRVALLTNLRQVLGAVSQTESASPL